MVAAATQIKAVSPKTAVIVWYETLLVYTGWNIDAHSTTVNNTLNSDANQQCATGHFLPAEFLEGAGRSLLLRNASGQLAITSYGHCHAYDHSQPQTRNYWTEMCLNMTDSGMHTS